MTLFLLIFIFQRYINKFIFILMGQCISQHNKQMAYPITQDIRRLQSTETYDSPKKDQIKVFIQSTDGYSIPDLKDVIAKAHKDLNSLDPIGKKRYFFQVVNFIFEWLRQAMNTGMSLHAAQILVSKDLLRACKDYPIGKIESIKSSIKDIKPSKMPDLLQGMKGLNKQKFTDKIKQLSLRSKKTSYEFNKQMQLILQKDGGFMFKGGYKNTGIKGYMRILTKILEGYFSDKQGSTQVYTDMNHYYWTPLFIYFNKLIDDNISKLKVEVYDWMRCRVFYRTIEELESAYARLNEKFGKNIFRVKNRINLNTRDILINLKYKDQQYAEIQLALHYDCSAYDFNHKLYELTREKLGVAYCCFTILLNEVGESQSHSEGVMTPSGYIKTVSLRQEVEIGFERMTKQDVQKEFESVEKLLDQWDVVALKTGVIRGSGYEKRLDQTFYGPEISEMMIIKRKTSNSFKNWLNWMD